LIKNQLISQISQIYYAKLGSNYRFTIITNGTLINEADLLSWRENGFESIKVTVDGNEASHNQRRPLKDGEDSYKLILDNLSIASQSSSD